LSGVVFLKADAKVRLFSELPNFFEKKNADFMKLFCRD